MKLWPGIVLLFVTIGCAGPSGRGLVDDDASYKIPAIKSAADSKDQKAVPQLIQDLENDDAAVRFYAIEALRRLTGQTLDYYFYADDTERQQAVERWKAWLAGQK